MSRNKEVDQEHTSHAHEPLNASDIFRRHFEAAFTPLPETENDKENNDVVNDDMTEASDTGSEVSQWSGLSESGEDPPIVEVVDHAVAGNGNVDEFHRARLKAFMVRPFRYARHPRYLVC